MNVQTKRLSQEDVTRLVLLALDVTQKGCRERLLSTGCVKKFVEETFRNPLCKNGRVRSEAVCNSYLRRWCSPTTTCVDYTPNTDDTDGVYTIKRIPYACRRGDYGLYRVRLIDKPQDKAVVTNQTNVFDNWIDWEAAKNAPSFKRNTPYKIRSIHRLDPDLQHAYVVILEDWSMALCLSFFNIQDRPGKLFFLQRKDGLYAIRIFEGEKYHDYCAPILLKIRAMPNDVNHRYMKMHLLENLF